MNKPLKGKEDHGNLAVLLTCITFLFFTGIDTSAKWLITAGMAVPVIVFFRYSGHLVFTVLSSVLQKDWTVWRMQRPGLTLLRGMLLVASTSLNFISLQYLPLTVTVSIFFTMPLMTTAIAAIFLKEQVGVRRWSAIAVGFCGVLIITQPWSATFHWAMLVSLFVTFMATVYNILTRVLAGQESAGTMQFYAAALPCVLLAPWAFSQWTWPEGTLNWAVCLAISFLGFAGHQIWVLALRLGEASALAPFGYVQIIYMTAASWLIFNQPPEVWTMVGACVVVASGMYVWVREQALQIRKSHRAP